MPAYVVSMMSIHDADTYKSYTDRVDVDRGQGGADIVYDSIEADMFAGSLKALAPCGHLVNFGQSSGDVEPVAMTTLAQKSLTVSRPILFHYLADPAAYRKMAVRVFSQFEAGVLGADEPHSFALSNAGAAHKLLASRAATPPIALTP